ncbi:MAG: DUF4224 domain-containing protein [Pseudomonadota bacterium]|nr:DUF4224 domain-containing protein [Pseudomonadota bacterium]
MLRLIAMIPAGLDTPHLARVIMINAGTFLTTSEMIELTGRKRWTQIAALRAEGIEHIIRIDGKPLVLRAYLFRRMGVHQSLLKAPAEPDWSALNGTAKA